jgi:hypothetical protein
MRHFSLQEFMARGHDEEEEAHGQSHSHRSTKLSRVSQFASSFKEDESWNAQDFEKNYRTKKRGQHALPQSRPETITPFSL